jgi:GntR family transcriptional regulator/MocR family aminotransferase
MLAHTRGLAASADQIMVTRGSQQALFLVAQALLGPGDLVAVEELGNPAAWSALRQTSAELVALPLDREGLDVDALAILARRRRLRAVYVTPHHQFPTNAVMPAHRRARLAELALAHTSRSSRTTTITSSTTRASRSHRSPPVPPAAT